MKLHGFKWDHIFYCQFPSPLHTQKEKKNSSIKVIIYVFLAVKECFFEDEIRCILIKKTKNGKKVKYFNRHCTNLAYNKKVCDICDKWFTNLSGIFAVASNINFFCYNLTRVSWVES